MAPPERSGAMTMERTPSCAARSRSSRSSSAASPLTITRRWASALAARLIAMLSRWPTRPCSNPQAAAITSTPSSTSCSAQPSACSSSCVRWVARSMSASSGMSSVAKSCCSCAMRMRSCTSRRLSCCARVWADRSTRPAICRKRCSLAATALRSGSLSAWRPSASRTGASIQSNSGSGGPAGGCGPLSGGTWGGSIVTVGHAGTASSPSRRAPAPRVGPGWPSGAPRRTTAVRPLLRPLAPAQPAMPAIPGSSHAGRPRAAAPGCG